MNLQSSFTYDNFGRRTLRTLQLNNTTIASAMKNIPEDWNEQRRLSWEQEYMFLYLDK